MVVFSKNLIYLRDLNYFDFLILGTPFLFDSGQWRDVTSNFLKERHPQFVVCFVTYKSFILRCQHPLYDLVSVALIVIAVILVVR